MVILSIADFHTSAIQIEGKDRLEPELETSTQYFTQFLSELVEGQPEWKPDYLCICGDIAKKACKIEYDLAKAQIEQIAAACRLTNDYILMVPGNHDINTLKINNNQEVYIEAIKKMLAHNRHDANENESMIVEAFKPYSAFRKEFINRIVYQSFPSSLIPEAMAHTCGYKVFETEKTVFIELNSSWLDLPHSNIPVRFGSVHIKHIYNQIQELKRRGFYIVTLFHHSLRYMDLDEYRARAPQFPVYDRIIEMSDLCLSGHEHGGKSKEPDMLGNICQYVLNGGFYSIDEHNKVMESSASLIKIDMNNEKLVIRKLMKDTNNTWREAEPIKTYTTRQRLVNETIFEKGMLCLPDKVSINNTPCKDRLYDTIILKLFGEGYQWSKNNSEDIFLLHSLKQESEISSYITFINMDDENGHTFLRNELNKLLIVVCLCRKDSETDKDNYLQLKREYKKDILQRKKMFFSLLIDF